jgi:hypothetical protein
MPSDCALGRTEPGARQLFVIRDKVSADSLSHAANARVIYDARVCGAVRDYRFSPGHLDLSFLLPAALKQVEVPGTELHIEPLQCHLIPVAFVGRSR